MTIGSKYVGCKEIDLDNPRIARRRGDEDRERAPTPEEGVRLIKAFRSIDKASLRNAVINFVEDLSETDNLQVSLRAFLDYNSGVSPDVNNVSSGTEAN
jgi:hypothetical protein